MSLLALALTAGLGTRLRPYTNLRAKPAIPFLGVPLALHALRHLEPLAINELFMNIHHRGEDIKGLDISVMNLPEPQYSDETKKILGSAGALHLVFQKTEADNYLLMNGDEVLLPKDAEFLKAAYEQHCASDAIATLITMEHPEVGQTFGGAWTATGNTVQMFSKKTIPGLHGHHYVGYLFLKAGIKKYFKPVLDEENILYETLTKAMADSQKVTVFPIETHWFETGETLRFIEASHKALDLLTSTSASPACKDLEKFLLRFSSFQFLVEKEDPSLASRLQAYLRKKILKAP